MSPHEPKRRRILEATMSVTAGMTFAGCSGLTDTGGDENTETNSGTTIQDLCRSYPGEFEAYDVGPKPMICEFDMLAVLKGNSSSGSTPGSNGWRIESDATGRGGIGFGLGVVPIEDRTDTEPGSTFTNQPELMDIEFNDETVTLYGPLEEAENATEEFVRYVIDGWLPYTINDTKLYFRLLISGGAKAGTDESIPEDCQAAVKEVPRRVGESLRVNEETTIESYVEEEWDNPP